MIIELLPTLDSNAERWPISVPPECDELLSSWLNRIAIAHGITPRSFAASIGLETRDWSSKLDDYAPAWLQTLLHAKTGVSIDRIAAMTIGGEPWHPIALLMQWRPSKTRATWVQFCPQCLQEDDEP